MCCWRCALIQMAQLAASIKAHLKTAALLKSERKLCGIILPGIEDCRAAVGHMKYVAGCEVKAVFNRRGLVARSKIARESTG